MPSMIYISNLSTFEHALLELNGQVIEHDLPVN